MAALIVPMSGTRAQTEPTGSEFLTVEQLGNAKKLMSRLGIPGQSVDDVINDYELTREMAFRAYEQQKKMVLWLQDSGVTVEELGDLIDIMQTIPTPTATLAEPTPTEVRIP